MSNWESQSWGSPSPSFIKRAILLSRPAEAWIESGTYFGETTKILAKNSKNVITIEASADLFNQFIENLEDSKIMALWGNSSNLLDGAILSLLDREYSQINFFLDAHNTGEEAFNSTEETPIIRELQIISQYLEAIKSCSIFVDDFRAFSDLEEVGKSNSTKYPTKNFLVEFANQHHLHWTVNHDIFIMSKVPSHEMEFNSHQV